MGTPHTERNERRAQWTPERSWSKAGDRPGVAPGRFDAKELAGVSAGHGLVTLVGTWVLLAAMIGAYLLAPSRALFAVVFVLVASRQYALLILMHDAFHSLLHPSRTVNDILGAWCIGFPCGSSYWAARSSHLAHHRLLGHAQDPERALHTAEDKGSPTLLARHFVRLLLGGQFLYTYVGATTPVGQTHPWPRGLARVGVRLLPAALAQAGLVGIFWLAGSWTAYVWLWLLPLLTLTVLFNGIRVFCDHANLKDEPGTERDRLVSYVSSRIERFFLAPFNMNYHAEHHLFPYVPHYNLPRLRTKLRSAEPAAFVQWRGTYVGFLRRFLAAR